MTTALSTLGLSALCIGLFGLFLLPSILAFATTPPDDLRRIHADLEGLLGEAGPGKRVLDIVHCGGYPATRYSAAKRRYIVKLERPDGSTEKRTVFIEVSLFGYGAMTVESRAGGDSAWG